MTTDPTTTTTGPEPDPPSQPGASGDGSLRDLRRRIRAAVAGAVGAVGAGDLDIGEANRILGTCGLPALPRQWTVRLCLTFVCEVTAATSEAAYGTAENTIEGALMAAPMAIDIEWDGREHLDALPGDFDRHALDTEPDADADRP